MDDLPEHADRRGTCVGGGVLPQAAHARAAARQPERERHEGLEQDAPGEGIAGVLEREQLEQQSVALVGSLWLPDEGHGLVAGQLAERSEVVSGV